MSAHPGQRELTARRVAVYTMSAAAVVIALLAFWALRSVLLLLFAATLVAIVLDGLARMFARKLPISRGVALAIAALLIVGLIGGISYLFGSELALQINQLVSLIPGGWDDLSARLGEDRLNGLADKFSPSGSNIFSIVQSILSFVSGILSATLLALLGGVFLATQPRTYRRGLLMMLPQSWEARADDTLHATGAALRAWLRGQLVSMLFVGTTIFAGLWLIGAPSPLALAAIAAILGFIPVIGPLMAAAPGVLVGLTMGGDAIWHVILIYFVVQQIDGNLINPLVMRHTVEIPPAVTMFALFSVGAIFGAAGLLLGGPITVLIATLIRKLWIEATLGKPVEPLR